MTKFFTRLCALGAFALLSTQAFAQQTVPTFYVPSTQLEKELTVDTQTPNGATPNGSEGSWYKWSVQSPNESTTFTAGNDPDGAGDNDSNKALFKWNATWPVINGNPLELIKEQKIQAIELNDCSPDATNVQEQQKTNILINLVKADILSIADYTNKMCIGEIKTISLTGTPNADITYTIGNGAAQIVRTDANGKATIDIEANDTNVLNNVLKLVINKVTYNNTQANGSTFSVVSNNLTYSGKSDIEININVSRTPTITEINF